MVQALEPCVRREIEREDAVGGIRPFQNLGMAESANGVVKTCGPMVFHAAARELEILGLAFVVLRPVDKLDDIVDLATGFRIEKREFRCHPQLIGQL